jgi:tRNA pseudouridine38-40 synthase
MRYFVEISYEGTEFYGWQKQKISPNTIQGEIEHWMSKLLRQEIGIIGCGRTDTGVHARGFYFHFDVPVAIDENFVHEKLNLILPKSIAVHRVLLVDDTAHARFGAYERSYVYRLRLEPNPFDRKFAWQHRKRAPFDLVALNSVASLLLNYDEFYPFCKEKSDVKTYICKLSKAEWSYNESKQVYEFLITSNRFLRGMIRLIVGTCLYVEQGKISLDDVEEALNNQTRLKKDYFVPPQGLTLFNIKYPYIDTKSYDLIY